MAYTKNSWKSGDVVTSSKLNHMEDGIANAGGLMFVGMTRDEQNNRNVLDKTWQEIYDVMAQGKLCIIRVDYGDPIGGITNRIVTDVNVINEEYRVVVNYDNYSTTSANGYPGISASGSMS